MKKNTYYFSHDYNARNDTKILYMRQDLGMEGYGIYWFLVEALADSGGILPLKIIPVLSKQMDVSEAKVNAIINSYELFQLHEDSFFSQRLMNHLQLRSGYSDSGKIGAEKRWNKIIENGDPIKGLNGKESKVNKNKRKVKDSSKQKKIDITKSNLFRQPNIPTIENVTESFIRNGGTKQMAELFYNKHSSTGWFLNNNPIINYISLIPNFIINFNKFDQNGNKSKQSISKTKLTSDEQFAALKSWSEQFDNASTKD